MTTKSTALAALALTALTAGSALAQCPSPTNYCVVSPNSVGPGAVMAWTGSAALADDDFHLVANGCPPGQTLLFYYGASQLAVPFGNGFRCVGAGGVGIFRFTPMLIDGSGTATMKVDYSVPPAGGGHHDPGVWIPGNTWYCQGWYRDPAAGGAFFNLSDALAVQVCAGDGFSAFAENFDGVSAGSLPDGWTTGSNGADTGTTLWELGAPSTVGPATAFSPENCVGTNLHADYGLSTDIWLRTPAIDLTGSDEAMLSFKEFARIEASGTDLDFGTVRLLAASDLSELAVLEAEVEGAFADWEDCSIILPGVAFTEPIILEFQFQADASDLLVSVENGSFELPAMADGVYNSSGGPGWGVGSGSGGIWNPDSTDGYPGGNAPDGQNVGWVYSTSGTEGALSQNVSAVLTGNTQYTLSAQVGNPFINGGAGARYRLELRAGGALLHSQAGSSPGSGQWQARSFTWNSGTGHPQLGQPLEIRLIAETSNGKEVSYDTVVLTADAGSGAGFPGWYIDDVEVRLEHGDTGGSWEVLPNSPLAPYYHHDDVCFVGEDIGWVCNISGEIWKTIDAGDSWTRVLNQPATAFRTITFVDEMNGWVGNLGQGGWVSGVSDTNPLYATTDGGLTWTAVTNISGPLPDGVCGLQAIGPNTIHGAGRYDGDAYFISSTDAGASWVSQNLTGTYDAFVDVHFITPMEGYITSSNGQGNAALLYTTNGGGSWITVITNNSYHYWKMGFASDDFGYGVCWSGQDADMWIQTYDGGQTWTDRHFANGFEANGIGFLNEQTGWIGGHEINTYETLDGGDSWNLFQIDTIYGDYINKFLRVGHDEVYAVGMRVYKYSEHHESSSASTGGVAPDPLAGFDNSLCSLDVTSANGKARITYTAPEDDNVQITIYIRGGLIYDRPVDEFQQAGTYSFEFTPHDSTPVLYASIVTGRYRQRVKFTIQP